MLALTNCLFPLPLLLSVELCPRDYESRADIRIATGSAFAGLILIAILTIVIMKLCNCGAGSD